MKMICRMLDEASVRSLELSSDRIQGSRAATKKIPRPKECVVPHIYVDRSLNMMLWCKAVPAALRVRRGESPLACVERLQSAGSRKLRQRRR